MKILVENNIRKLIAEKGFRNVRQFAKDKKLNYYLVRKLANNELNSISLQFLTELCGALECDIGDLLFVSKEDKQ